MWTYIATGESLQNLDWALSRGYLLTNGLGGYCASSLLGCNTRRYHGLLVAPVRHPLDRQVLISHFDELLALPDGEHYLNTTEYRDGFYPDGFRRLAELHLAPLPVWRWRVGTAEVTKSLVMVHGRNCVLARYAVRGAPAGARLVLSPFVAMRSFHQLTRARGDPRVEAATEGRGYRLPAGEGRTLEILFSEGQPVVEPVWYNGVYHRREAERGMEDAEDLLRVGYVAVDVGASSAVTVTLRLGPEDGPEPEFEQARGAELERRRELLRRADPRDQRESALVVAADQFVFRRAAGTETPTSVLAGYFWFGDWGRDAMVALPGLCLATGRHEEAREVLRLWAGMRSEGMIPNCLSDDGGPPAFNSVDASLWFIQACAATYRATGDREFLRRVCWPALVEIIERYAGGTRFGIRVDGDGLLLAGDRNTQLTWMDAKHGGTAFTPRHGKAVEVNALWISGLHLAAELGAEIGSAAPGAAHRREAVGEAFRKAFWNESAGCLYDCITEGGPDGRIRPNQLWAISLPHAPVTGEQGRRVVDVCRRKLLTPCGLRTLSPDDPGYRGRYVGGWAERDGAYHQGTVWPWLLGAYVDALMATAENSWSARQEAQRVVESALQTLDAGIIGTIGEIFDGEAPHAARGASAQAWSVAEILRVKKAYEL